MIRNKDHSLVMDLVLLWRVRRRVGVLPAVTLAVLVLLTGAVDGQLLHLLLLRPVANTLLPLLDSLQVALALFVRIVPIARRLASGTHHQC